MRWTGQVAGIQNSKVYIKSRVLFIYICIERTYNKVWALSSTLNRLTPKHLSSPTVYTPRQKNA
jgi:hypothetical protein